MRLNNSSRVLLSVVAYFALLGIVAGGGALGAQALLSTVPQPGFMLPEKASPSSIVKQDRPTVAVVRMKPYRPDLPPQSGWKTSIYRAHAERIKAPAMKDVSHQSPSKKTKVKRHVRKRGSEAMDAHASDHSWRIR